MWKKRWVVVRRPYVFLFRDERDYCERGLINLAQAKTEYSAEQQQIVKNTFSITTKQNVFLIQTMNEKDLYDWLYAINPLLAGKIRYTYVLLSRLGVPTNSRSLTGECQKLSFSTLTKIPFLIF